MKNLIVSDPSITMGKPVISGTRITVESIIEKLAEGETVEQILEAHPRLTKETVQAALSFAAQALRAEMPPHGGISLRSTCYFPEPLSLVSKPD